MSALDSFHAPAFAIPARSTGLASRLRASLTDWVNVRNTRNALHRLSDRELDDIGLCRGDINRVARGL